MSKKLFVGNIDWNATPEDLQAFFAEVGEVEEAIIVKDKFSGRSKGFGFVTMVNEADADTAISTLEGKEFSGRPLSVKEALPPKPRNENY